MTETLTPRWYEILSETERRECAADLTDAYFAALNTGTWMEFQAHVQLWFDRAAQKQLVAV